MNDELNELLHKEFNEKELFVIKFTNIIVAILSLLFVFGVALASVSVFYAGLIGAIR